jgi:hypothetical protein
MVTLNEAGWDRIVRIVLGVALLGLGWGGIVTGGWGPVFKVMGFIPFITGLAGWCPLYAVLGVRTRQS